MDGSQHRAEGRLDALLPQAVVRPPFDPGLLAAFLGRRQRGAGDDGAAVAEQHAVHGGVGAALQLCVRVALGPLLAADPLDGLVHGVRAVRVEHHAPGLHRLGQAIEQHRVHQHPVLAQDGFQDLGLEAAAELGQHRHRARHAQEVQQVVDDAERLHPRRIALVVLDPELAAGGAEAPVCAALADALHRLMEAHQAMVDQRARMGGHHADHPRVLALELGDALVDLRDVALGQEVGDFHDVALEA